MRQVGVLVGVRSGLVIFTWLIAELKGPPTSNKHDQTTIMEILESSFLGFPPSTRVVPRPCHLKLLEMSERCVECLRVCKEHRS